jgi:hypothetical protein
MRIGNGVDESWLRDQQGLGSLTGMEEEARGGCGKGKKGKENDF